MSIFTRGGHTKRKAVGQGLRYGLSIIVIFGLLGLYLLGKFPFAHDSTVSPAAHG